METPKVYFPATWGMSTQELYELYLRLAPIENPPVEIVPRITDADYVVVQDIPDEIIPLDKKVIFFQREPDHVGRCSYNKENLYKSYHHDEGECWLPQTWWLGFSYDELKKLPIPPKKHDLTVVDSGRTELQGHYIRLNAIQEVLNKVPDLHMYGHITQGRERTGPFKWSLPPRAKEEALLDYRYTLSIENGRTPFYFSEKIADPILCWSTPIYWGCSEIGKFLPAGSFIEIKELTSSIGEQVRSIIESDFHEQNIDALAEARDLILDKYNLIPTVKTAISEGEFFLG